MTFTYQSKAGQRSRSFKLSSKVGLPSPRYSLFSKEGSSNSAIPRVIGWKRIVPSVFPFKQRLSLLKAFIKLADFFPHEPTSRNVELIPILSAGAKVVQASNWAFPLSRLSLPQERTRSGFTLKSLFFSSLAHKIRLTISSSKLLSASSRRNERTR